MQGLTVSAVGHEPISQCSSIKAKEPERWRTLQHLIWKGPLRLWWLWCYWSCVCMTPITLLPPLSLPRNKEQSCPTTLAHAIMSTFHPVMTFVIIQPEAYFPFITVTCHKMRVRRLLVKLSMVILYKHGYQSFCHMFTYSGYLIMVISHTCHIFRLHMHF